MKRFIFRLQKVLNYKEQILESLKNEHSAILIQIYSQENLIDGLKEQYDSTSRKCNEEKTKEVLKLENIVQYGNYLKSLYRRIEDEKLILKSLQIKEEKKRAEVVSAKQDVESIEKLKEKQFEVYNKELRAEQDLVVEEFITNRISAV